MACDMVLHLLGLMTSFLYRKQSFLQLILLDFLTSSYVFGLPLFVAFPSLFNRTEHKSLNSIKLFWTFIVYGLITATTVTVTILCVAIHRRHLMVWGLFAPKFVFDVVGLILTDILIFVASIYYF